MRKAERKGLRLGGCVGLEWVGSGETRILGGDWRGEEEGFGGDIGVVRCGLEGGFVGVIEGAWMGCLSGVILAGLEKFERRRVNVQDGYW